MAIDALVSAELTRRIGLVVLHSLWQGGLVALVVAGALFLMRRRSTNARYVVACLGLLAMVALPVGTLWLDGLVSGERAAVADNLARVRGSGPEARPTTGRNLGEVGEEYDSAERRMQMASATAASGPPGDGLRGLLSRVEPLAPWVALAWFVGVLVMAVRLAGGWAGARLLRCVGVRPIAPALEEVARHLARRVLVSGSVRVLQSSLAHVPTVVGWLRPVVLLPVSAVTGLTRAQLESVLAHELAHIRRHDYLVNAVQTLVEVLMFYHPGVWWLSKRIRAEREHCCDDVAVAACEDPREYARALTELEGLRIAGLTEVMAATGGPLMQRVRRIMAPSPSARPLSWPAGVAALALLVALVAAPLAMRTAQGQLPGPANGGVGGMIEDGVPTVYADGVPAVVSVAKAKLDELFPELMLEQVQVHINTAPGHFDHTTTDRIGTIYVTVGRNGIGEKHRPDAGSVAILCEALMELYNPWRLPGFERYVAHRYLVPAVVAELGTDALPDSGTTGDPDDPTGLAAIVADPLCASAHPDYAATWALMMVDSRSGFEAAKTLVYDLPEDALDPFGLLREAAVAADPELGNVFSIRDAATALEVDEEGWCVVASFEEDEPFTRSARRDVVGVGEVPMAIVMGLDAETTQEWSTHGDWSLRLTTEAPTSYMSAHIVDTDWRFKDWTRFSQLELDLMLEADEPQLVCVYANDDVWQGHGRMAIMERTLVAPGEEVHISVPLTPEALAGERNYSVPYFDGQLRDREIANIYIQLPSPTGPFTLYVDGIRLLPREEEGAVVDAGGGEATPVVGDDDDIDPDAELQAALAEKRVGRLKDAEKRLLRLLRLDPGNVEAHRALGWTLADQGRKAEAAEQFRKVIEFTQDAAVKDEAGKALERLE